MEWYYIALIAGAAAAVAFVLLMTLPPAIFIDRLIFTRQDKIPLVKYFTPEDFSLKSEELSVSYFKKPLYARLYYTESVEECKGVVIFQHGFGAGSSSYVTEIAHFAKAGYAVAAADSFGCNNSAGKRVKGFYQGAETVIATYIAVKGKKELAGKKIFLIGHSWGAYSVLCASKKVAVDGVVAMSAFNSPAQCITDNMKAMGNRTAVYGKILRPFFAVINFFKFGAKGNARADRAIARSGVPALIIHGERDAVVPISHSAARLSDGANVQKLILKDKRHNPYNTAAAEDKLRELASPPKFESEESAKKFFAAFDWNAVTEEDGEVMKKIDAFLAKNL